MAVVYSENATHRANLLAAESARQVAIVAAAGDRLLVKSADVTYATTALASARANSCGTSQWETMLRELQQPGG